MLKVQREETYTMVTGLHHNRGFYLHHPVKREPYTKIYICDNMEKVAGRDTASQGCLWWGAVGGSEAGTALGHRRQNLGEESLYLCLLGTHHSHPSCAGQGAQSRAGEFLGRPAPVALRQGPASLQPYH